ncbi:MAG: GNAT family N-acetyltransferase [Candidatus Poribacteria bacterium]
MVEGPRGIMPDELDELSELVGKVFNWQMRNSFPTLFCKENADNMRIMKEDGKIVSHIGIVVRDMIINGCKISVGNVGAVCTDENYRKRGYAWSILEDAIKKLRADGVDMLLVSGSRSLYIQHGCTHVGKVSVCSIERGTPIIKAKVQPRKYQIEDLPEWANLYKNEPVRFHRPYNDFHDLTTTARIYRPSRALYSIVIDGNIRAYVDIGKVKLKTESIAVDEYAGSRRAILASVPYLLEQYDVQRCNIPIPVHDLEFTRLVESMGLSLSASHHATGGTITIINFPRLCEKLMPLFEEKVGVPVVQNLRFSERDETYAFRLDGEEAVYSDAHDVARLIFGDPPGIEKPTEIPAEGRLRDVLKAIFPIPRPEYGLSYI